jgi:hypothetical protein
MNIEINIFTVLEKDLKNVSEETENLATLKVDSLPKDTAEIETGMAEKKSSPGTRQTDSKNLVWFGEIGRKLAKLSMPTFTYRFFLLIIFCFSPKLPPPPLVSKERPTTHMTHMKTEKERQLADVRGGEMGLGEESNHRMARIPVLEFSKQYIWGLGTEY